MGDLIREYHSQQVDMLWFDLDDTLWAMTANSCVCLSEIYYSEHLDRWFQSEEEWDRIYHEVNLSLWEQYSAGEISRSFLRSERFARPLRIVGVDEATAEEMSAHLDIFYLDLLGDKTLMIDGARDALDYLRSRGYRMGIVTNGFREVQYRKLRSSHIEDYFDCVVLSDDAGINKPDVRFFEYAERQADTVGGVNIIVGDNPMTDVYGALKAGWRGVWFNPSQKSAPEELVKSNYHYKEIADLADLQRIFK